MYFKCWADSSVMLEWNSFRIMAIRSPSMTTQYFISRVVWLWLGLESDWVTFLVTRTRTRVTMYNDSDSPSDSTLRTRTRDSAVCNSNSTAKWTIFTILKHWQNKECTCNIVFKIIIIIIIQICSAHISTLLGAQGAETEKTWIQTIYNDSKNNIMCRDTCTMQLQIYLWHKMSFKQRLKSGLSLVTY